MAIQTCLPLSLEHWIWRIEPQVVSFTKKAINVFWGGVRVPRPCVGRITCEYLDLVEYNQPHWLSIEPFCVCGKLLYYVVLHEKDRRKQWVQREQSIVDFELIPGSFQMHHSRYYGNEDGHPNSLPGCGISYPFDTRSTLTSFLQQCNIWQIGSEIVSGNVFDFYLFDPIIDETELISCHERFSCRDREEGWYFELVLLNAQPDLDSDPPVD